MLRLLDCSLDFDIVRQHFLLQIMAPFKIFKMLPPISPKLFAEVKHIQQLLLLSISWSTRIDFICMISSFTWLFFTRLRLSRASVCSDLILIPFCKYPAPCQIFFNVMLVAIYSLHRFDQYSDAALQALSRNN
mgnify:CR=1 FL=1